MITLMRFSNKIWFSGKTKQNPWKINSINRQGYAKSINSLRWR